MALIKCPECGKEISDKASFCPGCGCPMEPKKEKEQNIYGRQTEKEGEVEKRKGKKYKLKLSHMIIALILIIALAITTVFIIKNVDYNNAVKAFESENYIEAYDYFKNSDYKESSTYLQKTLEKYCDYLIANNQFGDVELYLEQITDKKVADKLSNELKYQCALDDYRNGAFESAYESLKAIKTYKDAKQIMSKILVMKNIQGEWVLYGDYHKDLVRGTLKIDGWNATAYHLSKSEEVGSCKLKFQNEETYTPYGEQKADGAKVLKANKAVFIFESDDIEYQIAYYDGFLIIESYRDEYYEELEEFFAPLTPWMHYGEKMCFEKPI